jgi:hypothetical protein
VCALGKKGLFLLPLVLKEQEKEEIPELRVTAVGCGFRGWGGGKE